MSEDDPITLKEACELIFRGRIGVATLRAEAAKGRLALRRIGRQDFVTLRDVRDLVEQCRVEKPRPGSISIRKDRPGLSETARDSSAQARTTSHTRRHREIKKGRSLAQAAKV